MMDKKRFTEISGHEALKLLSENKKVFPGEGSESSYYILSNKRLVFHDRNGSEYNSNFSIGDFVEKDWYAKKPFDVRLEMLARPDEWVGAYSANGSWFKVGFCSDRMRLVISKYESLDTPLATTVSNYTHSLNRCIPIEDVPKGGLQ